MDRPASGGSGRPDLGTRQAALVAALVGGAPLPPGFDPVRVRAASEALLRKRADEVAATWPALRAWYGPAWARAFATWAAGRPPHGSLRDGWDLARIALTPGATPTPHAGLNPDSEPGATGTAGPTPGTTRHTDALIELAQREARLRYDGTTPPRPRRLPALRRAAGHTVIQFAGRLHTR